MVNYDHSPYHYLRMKKHPLFCIVAFLLCTTFVQAQESVLSNTFSHTFFKQSVDGNAGEKSLFSVYSEKKYIRFKRMRNAGIVLTSVGAGFLATGVVLISTGIKEDEDYNGNYGESILTPGERKYFLGLLFVLLGVGFEGGGIPLWAIGSKKMKQYGNGFRLQSSKNGLAFTYAF